MIQYQEGDPVILISAQYGPLKDLPGKVVDPSPSRFTVDLGGYRVLIADPQRDIKGNGLDLAAIAEGLGWIVATLPDSVVTVKDGKVEVEIDERLFLMTFGEDHGYRRGSGKWSRGHVTTVGDTTFCAPVSYDYYDTAKTWLAAQDAEEATVATELVSAINTVLDRATEDAEPASEETVEF